MITDEIKQADITIPASTRAPIALEKQARDLSEKVFFDIHSLLQRAQYDAEENLAAYQSLANAEIAHMDAMITGLEEKNSHLMHDLSVSQTSQMHLRTEKMALQTQIEQQHTDVLTLQDSLNRLQSHHKHIQASHESETSLLKENIARYRERETALSAQLQEEKAEKLQLQSRNAELLAMQESLRIEMHDRITQLRAESQEHHQQWQRERHEKTTALEEKLSLQKMLHDIKQQHLVAMDALKRDLAEDKIIHQRIIDKLKEDFDEKISTTEAALAHEKATFKATLEQKMLSFKNAAEQHLALQIEKHQAIAVEKIRRLESLLSLERENTKKAEHISSGYIELQNELTAWKKQCKTLEDNSVKDRQTLHETAIKQKTLEKDISVIAQKKLTVEMNMKQLHKELIECKRIISALRKQQIMDPSSVL